MGTPSYFGWKAACKSSLRGLSGTRMAPRTISIANHVLFLLTRRKSSTAPTLIYRTLRTSTCPSSPKSRSADICPFKRCWKAGARWINISALAVGRIYARMSNGTPRAPHHQYPTTSRDPDRSENNSMARPVQASGTQGPPWRRADS